MERNYSMKETYGKRAFVIVMILSMILSMLTPFMTESAYADTGDVGVGTKVKLTHVKLVKYGDGNTGLTHQMRASGIDDSLDNRYVFCTQPHLYAPDAGTYTIDKMYTSDTGNAAMLRKLVYYSPSYPGWSKGKAMWFSSGNWSNDDAYGIMHIALSYATSGYDDGMKGVEGVSVKSKMYTSYWNKMKEIVEDCKSDEKVPDPPTGFKVFYIINSGKQNIIGGTLENGELTLTKKSANEAMSKNNTCYSLEGAEFGVYKGSTKVATLTTKADGTSNTVELEAGTYTVKELKAPKGYAFSPDQTVTVKAGVKNTVSFSDQPKDDPIAIMLEKGDSETLKASPQGAAKLAGAVYEVKYYKHTSSGKTLDRTYRFKTNEKGIAHFTKEDIDTSFKNSDFYYSAAGAPCLPLGTVTVQEVQAPEGYLLNDKIYTAEIKDDGGKVESVYTYNVPKIGSNTEVAEQVKRGDIEFVKVGDGTLERLAGVPFKITSLTTGESHTIVSDKNGYVSTASSWNKHTHNTNQGKTSEDGIWFGEVKPNDSKGALIYDEYELEEQPCKANEGYDLVKIKFSVYKDAVTVPMGTLTDDKIEIGTTAKDDETKSHMGKAEKTVYITDTVKYSGLKKGQEYKLIGTLMDQETGKPIMNGDKPVTAEETFTAKKSTGEVEVEFKVPGELVKGKATVVFEDLYQKDIKLAIHADIEDKDQTVYYPDVKTTAKDSKTQEGIAKPEKEVTIVDTVSYSGVQPGKEYTVKGTLMDKKTGKAITAGDKPVTAEATFTAEKSSGTVDVTFKFDASHLEGNSTVVFENLEYRGKEIAIHADLNDEGQTVHFPDVKTKAEDAETKLPVSYADEDVTIIDTVKYTNLKPGLEYKVSGTLMNKETKKPLMNGDKEVTAETTFVPEKADGEVKVTFHFSGVDLRGKSIVAFEKLEYNKIEVAVHADLSDKDQTIDFPEIGTTAKDKADGDKKIDASKRVTIVDTVKYKNLVPMKKYTVKGVLMDKSTGKELMVNGKPVTAEESFTARSKDGSVDEKFTFDASELKDRDLVVFEKLYYGEALVTDHQDLDDEGQTVKVVTPEHPSYPKTGDTTKMLPWLALLLASGAGLTVFGVRRKKLSASEDAEEIE